MTKPNTDETGATYATGMSDEEEEADKLLDFHELCCVQRLRRAFERNNRRK